MPSHSFTVAQYLDLHITMCGRPIKEIAAECRISSRLIDMYRTGAIKVPIDVAGRLAVATGAEPREFLDLAMSEYMPGAWAAIIDAFPALREPSKPLRG